MMRNLEMNNIEETRTLNPYQKEAVLDENPACLVNANVGSGKTTVLIEKVRYRMKKTDSIRENGSAYFYQ